MNGSNKAKMAETDNKTDLALTKRGKEDIQFANFTSVDQMLAFGAQLVKSKLTPLTSPEAVMAAVLMGKELGFGVMASVNNIYPINGRATSGVHIINALVLKAGVVYEVIADYAPLYSFIDKKGVVHSEDAVLKRKDLFQVVTESTPVNQLDTSKVMVMLNPKPMDYRTTISFSRQIRQANGEWKEQIVIVSRGLTDYAHLLDKDNWKNNPKGMLFNRVLATGSRAIADDVTLGLYLTEELTEEPNLPSRKQSAKASQQGDVIVDTTASEVVEVKEEDAVSDVQPTNV